MRVLSVAQDYYPFLERGGRPWKVGALGKELVARGHEVTVVTADLGLDEGFRRLGVPWDRSAARRAWGHVNVHDGVQACYLDVLLSWRAVTVSPGLVPFCRAEVARHHVAHVFGLYDLFGPPVAWYCRRAGVPYVVEPMGMFQPIVRSLRKKRLYHALLGGPLITGAARIIATSERERDELVEGGVAEKTIVVRRNGIDLAPFRNLPPRGAFRASLGFRKQDFVLLFLGRLSQKKGLDLLLGALPALPPHVKLAVVGPDDGDGSVQALARETTRLGLEARVRICPPRYDEAKLEALVDADLFVLPSQNENFGNAVVEAIACGVPALVTRECGVAPLVEGRAAIVVPYDARAIEGGLRAALSDPVALARMGEQGASVARELSWHGPVEAMVALYESLAGSRVAAA